MKRLTKDRTAEGIKIICDGLIAAGAEPTEGDQRYLRLAEYEQTGLSPEQIKELQKQVEESVKQGQWEWEPGYVGTQARCSVCKRSPIGFYSLPKSQIGRLPEFPFCPKCGVKMDSND